MVIDKSNYIKAIEDFPLQCRKALELPKGMVVPSDISNIVVCGMGGSAIGGDLLKSCLSRTIPVIVNREYELPKFVNENSLVFLVSYSGNTEETLSCYKEAAKKGCVVVAISSGGKLSEHCSKTINIPSGLQPRAALGYLFFPMLGLLHNSGITEVSNEELNEMLATLRDTNYYKESGEALAKKIKNRIPVVYSSSLLAPAAYRFKTQINENSKLPAFCHVFPEMNHNELVGYKHMDRDKFVAILIRDKEDHPRIRKRMDICREIFERKVDVEEISTKGTYLLSRMFSVIYLGDFASYYLALSNREDPAPVDIIEYLKRELAK